MYRSIVKCRVIPTLRYHYTVKSSYFPARMGAFLGMFQNGHCALTKTMTRAVLMNSKMNIFEMQEEIWSDLLRNFRNPAVQETVAMRISLNSSTTRAVVRAMAVDMVYPSNQL